MLVAVMVTLAWREWSKYEEGVLEVYAVQQDGYVQLVLDQINIQDNRENEEIVQNILETLDASSNHYWTLSDTGSLVFVKDVMETNRYKGFTQESYFTSGSAGTFIKNLQKNRVIHDTISIKGQTFVASGVKFTYSGRAYSMCLLTSTGAVLDQNEYLSAKITLTLLIMIALAVMVSGGFGLALMSEHWQKRYEQEKQEREKLFRQVEKMNQLHMKELLFHPRYTAFYPGALPTLLSEMEKKQIWPLDMVLVQCESETARDNFLAVSQIRLDKKVVRVILDEQYVLLLFMRRKPCTEPETRELIESLKGRYVKSKRWEQQPLTSLKQEFVSFWKGGQNDEQ